MYLKHCKIKFHSSSLFSWASDGINYLGIRLTNSTSSLYQANVLPLLQSLPTELKSLKRERLSFMGQIATIKMLILPKILYLFRTVIIPIPSSYLQKLQILILAFIWNKNPLRCSTAIILAPKRLGGLEAPNLKLYYSAAVLDQIKYWWSPSPDKLWFCLEASMFLFSSTHLTHCN